jgi:hypothetical protein
VPADCQSNVCTGQTCQAPSCSDGLKNQSETDIDCGGTCAAQPCAVGKGCAVATDCITNRCGVTNLCEAPPCDYKATWLAWDSLGTDGRIRPSLGIRNNAATNLDLSKLALRYWFTNSTGSGAGSLNYNCVQPVPAPLSSCSAYSPTFDGSDPNRSLLLTFNSGILGAGQVMQGLKADVYKSGGDNQLLESDDWSYDTAGPTTAHDPWNKVTLYYNGVLVWGCEPNNANCASNCQ